ncbi:putative holin-like toxin [Bacillus siamensis]|uniref:putative holin-like toxin n=1 Tax=Bacillus siamensis TaxID=659243 RepID=UPI0039E13C9F
MDINHKIKTVDKKRISTPGSFFCLKVWNTSCTDNSNESESGRLKEKRKRCCGAAGDPELMLAFGIFILALLTYLDKKK